MVGSCSVKLLRKQYCAECLLWLIIVFCFRLAFFDQTKQNFVGAFTGMDLKEVSHLGERQIKKIATEQVQKYLDACQVLCQYLHAGDKIEIESSSWR